MRRLDPNRFRRATENQRQLRYSSPAESFCACSFVTSTVTARRRSLSVSIISDLVDREDLHVFQQNVGIALPPVGCFVRNHDDIDEMPAQDKAATPRTSSTRQ